MSVPDNTPLTVMIAEDDKFLMKVYQSKLVKEGFNIITACDGEEAIEKLTSGDKPDIILTDIVMPKKSGLEVLDYVKKDPNLSTIPVIILSNLGQEGDVEKGKKAGASDYIIKSNISIADVVEKIRKYTSVTPQAPTVPVEPSVATPEVQATQTIPTKSVASSEAPTTPIEPSVAPNIPTSTPSPVDPATPGNTDIV